MKKLTLGMAILMMLLCSSIAAHAQTGFCEPNLDFESGDFSYWKFYRLESTSSGIDTVEVFPPALPTVDRMTLTSGTGTNPYGGFPVVAPGGGKYSFRLGREVHGDLGDMASYTIDIPATDTDFALIYRFALVIEDPGHSPASGQPAFSIITRDMSSGELLPCGQHTYVAGSLPGFLNATPNIFYKPWATGIISLGAYAGKSIRIDFIRKNCYASYHFACAYFDLECGSNVIKAKMEDCDSTVTLSGPLGFRDYSWRDSSLTTVLGSDKEITLTSVTALKKVKLIVTPFPGYGCGDTLTALFLPFFETKTKDTAVCIGTRLILDPKIDNGKPPYTYSWTPAAGLSCTDCSNPSVTATAPASYIFSVTDSTGCTRSDTVDIAVQALPVIKSADRTICLGDTATIRAEGAETYQWTPATGLLCSTCSSTVSSPAETTIYTVTGTDDKGCKGETQVKVNVNYPVKISTNHPLPICAGQQVLLKAEGSRSYQWSPSESLVCSDCDSTIAAPLKTTTYTIIGTDSNQCKDTAYLILAINPLPVIIVSKDTAICARSSIALLAGGAKQYSWSPSESLSCPDCDTPVASPPGNTVYTVTGTNFNGCVDSNKVSISIITDTLPHADFIITPPTATIEDPVFYSDNQSRNAMSYEWFYKDQLIGASEDLTHSFPEYGQHCITLVARNVCGLTDTAVRCCNVVIRGKLVVPNVFTPNGDGRNDGFRALLFSPHRVFSMKIFNRYGEEVFRADKPEAPWDGTFNGQPEELGVYFYLIKVTFDYQGANEELYKGDVTLIR
jgi:gliding motility-associated-like protein